MFSETYLNLFFDTNNQLIKTSKLCQKDTFNFVYSILYDLDFRPKDLADNWGRYGSEEFSLVDLDHELIESNFRNSL